MPTINLYRMKNFVGSLNLYKLSSRPNNKVIVLVAFFSFIVSSLNVFQTHPYLDHIGVDQFHIERIAEYLINLDSLSQVWTHGIGYPALVSPFIRFKYLNPLNAANLFIYVLTVSICANAITQIVKSNRKCNILLLLLFASFLLSPDIYFWIIGASNSISASLLLVSCAWALVPKPPKRMYIYLALMTGIDFSSRYIDAILLSPLIITALLNYKYSYNIKINKILPAFSFIILFFITLTLSLHHIFLGDILTTPYDAKIPATSRLLVSSEFKLNEGIIGQFNYRNFEWILPNLYSTLIQPRQFASIESIGWGKSALLFTPLFLLFPFSIPKLILYYINNIKLPSRDYSFILRANRFLLAFLFCLLIWTIFYASGWAYSAHDLKHLCLRYFMGWFTILLFFTFIGLFIKGNKITFLISISLYLILYLFPPLYKTIVNYDGFQVISVDRIDAGINREYKIPKRLKGSKKNIIYSENSEMFILSNPYDHNLSILNCSSPNNTNYRDKNNARMKTFCDETYLIDKHNATKLLYEPDKGMEFQSISDLDNNNYALVYGYNGDSKMFRLLLNDGNISISSLSSKELATKNIYIEKDDTTKYAVKPIPFQKGVKLQIPVKKDISQNEMTVLNFEMTNSHDTFFPQNVSISCSVESSSVSNYEEPCTAYKIARLNNRWSIKIRNFSSYHYINFVINEIDPDSPKFLPLDSLSLN